VAQPRFEAAVELDGVNVRDAVGEVPREDAEGRADLAHDVARPPLGCTVDHAEDVLVDEEMLPELLLRNDVHKEKAAVALASICAPSSATSSPRASASVASVWTTNAGS